MSDHSYPNSLDLNDLEGFSFFGDSAEELASKSLVSEESAEKSVWDDEEQIDGPQNIRPPHYDSPESDSEGDMAAEDAIPLRYRLPTSLRFRNIHDYRAIEIVRVDGLWQPPPKRKYFPTHWLQITNPYWKSAQETEDAELDENGHREFLSTDDGATIQLWKRGNGDFWAERAGVTVIVKYSAGGTGGFFQFPQLEEVDNPTPKPPNQRVEAGVDLRFITHESPYWKYIFWNLTYKKKGSTLVGKHPIDDVVCFVKMEEDGAIKIRRRFQEVHFLEALVFD